MQYSMMRCIHVDSHSQTTARLLEGASCLRDMMFMLGAEEPGGRTTLSVDFQIRYFVTSSKFHWIVQDPTGCGQNTC